MVGESIMCLYAAEFGDHDAPSIVLLHGLGMGHRMWLPQFQPLSEHFHILAPDLPGFARSSSLGPFTLVGAADHILGLIKKRCRPTVHLCGLSLGAMVALQLSISAPDIFASLTLSGAQVNPPRILLMAQRLIFTAMPERILLKAVSSDIPGMNDFMADAACEDVFLTGKQGLVQALNEVAQANFRPMIHSIRQPTLIVCGSRDRANLPAAHELASEIPGARLRIFPNAGHVLNVEMPVQFTAGLQEFISDIERVTK